MKTFLALVIMALVAGVAHAQIIDATKIKNSRVKYTPPEKFKEYPPPALTYINFEGEGGDYGAQYMDEIDERIIYPFLSEYRLPVSSIIVDFCPLSNKKKTCEGEMKKKVMIEIEVKIQGGVSSKYLFELSSDGHYHKDAYKEMLDEDYISR